MTLTEFLLARIEEDEDAARAATEDPGPPGRSWFDGWSDDHPVGRHIGRWTPARVLAECSARRRIVGMCDDEQFWHDLGGYDDDSKYIGQTEGAGAAETYTLRALAAAYTDHPDYDESWAV